MRISAPSFLLLLLAPLAAAHARPGEHAVERMLFVAPDGKPFRGQPGQPYPSAAWFAAADVNHDGKLTRAEYIADFIAYFDTLDTDHDGEIGPDEIAHYERFILPEVQMSSDALGGHYGDDAPASGSGDDDNTPPQPPERPGGASFFGFFGAPEPLLAMDANFNRGISRAEYAASAQRTWQLLDPDGKPWLTFADLPATQAQR